jgi:hypothetical protein
VPEPVPALGVGGTTTGGGFGSDHTPQRHLLDGALPAGFSPQAPAGGPRLALTDAAPPDAPVSDRSARPD